MVDEKITMVYISKTCVFILFCVLSIGLRGQKISDYYQIVDVHIPDDVILEVGGLAFNHHGELAVSTRRGEIWIISNPYGYKPEYRLFAQGMHELLGLAYRDGSYYAAQRGELTKITDTDEDGQADLFETIFEWDLSGNYHEYSFGPVFLPNGDMFITLNLAWHGGGKSFEKWRGWMIKITKEGEVIPWATGLRSPAGFGINSSGDIFYAENQGDWVGSGRVTHLEKGDFAGHPQGLHWTNEPNSPLKLKAEYIHDNSGYTLYEYSKLISSVKPPSVWFPHTLMGVSTSDIINIPAGFGPFEGQQLVGDQGHSKIMRMFQEKVNGVYQGACFPFVDGFESGILRMRWSDQNDLFVGMTSRGWTSVGPKIFGLQRLEWTGKTPFDIKAIRATSSGFELEFTQPLEMQAALVPSNYQVNEFTYKYHQTYGSPVHDLSERKVIDLTISEDRRKVKVDLDGLSAGYIYSFELNGIVNAKGQELLNKVGYYTLNEIPEGGSMMNHRQHVASESESILQIGSDKRVTEKPEEWDLTNLINIELQPKPGLKFSTDFVEIKAGTPVRLTFDNVDDMLHNVVIIKPGKADAVVEQALNLGLNGQRNSYIPESNDVLFHTNLVQPESKDVIYFRIEEPGDYHFVCTYPGHGQIMRGILRVK